jgi:Family of unknown function (DUF6353)
MSIGAKLALSASRALLKTKKNEPTILFVAGAVSVVAAGVLACRATLKVDEVLQKNEKDNSKIDIMEKANHPEYSVEDAKNDRKIVKVQTAVALGKLYAPAIGLAVVGIACLSRSHLLLLSRNNALMAAYTALNSAVARYRERVAEEVGNEKERKWWQERNLDALTDIQYGENGDMVGVQKSSIDKHSPYARFFDETTRSWSPVPEENLTYLLCQQNWANEKLRSKGHLFLNEVYDMLGIERSKAGQVVGWVIRNDGKGDNYVDFGIYELSNKQRRLFVNGYEPSILLDFNVDGVIYDLIEKE